MNARPALSTGGSQRGYLIPIGGAEEKEIHPVILRLYVELCGGITVVDPSDLEYSSIAKIRKAERYECVDLIHNQNQSRSE
jgi:hypothetical protein